VAIPQQTDRFYEFGPFCIVHRDRLLLCKGEGEAVPLTPKQFDILLLLVENRGHVVERNRLMEEIWPETAVEEGNLTTNISMLRKALDEGASGQQYIQTLPRRGYRFVGQVNEVVADLPPPIARRGSGSPILVGQEEADSETATLRSGETEPVARSRHPGPVESPFKALAAFMILAIALAAIIFVKFLAGKPVPPRSEIRSLVVLPLENLSADPAQDYFVDGVGCVNR
jgi:DNA-binding winged helix-turn-helix (wHTH) protein